MPGLSDSFQSLGLGNLLDEPSRKLKKLALVISK